MKFFACVFALVVTAACARPKLKPLLVPAEENHTTAGRKAEVREDRDVYIAQASAPIPAELTDKANAQELAKQAAVDLAQTNILTFVLGKRTRSGKTLADAEIPYIDMQKQIRDTVKAGIVKSAHWTDAQCTVTVAVDKRPIVKILKAH